MGLFISILRFADYYKRNGVGATFRRLGLGARRTLSANRSVILYRDVPVEPASTEELPSSLKVQRIRSEADLSAQDMAQITSFWNPKLAQQNIKERFGLGASLWLIRSEGNLAGYGWTLQGRTVEPHYFPLGERDVQFLDFHVFPKYRGRAMDWVLMNHIIAELAADGCKRAYGEAAEWNKASLSSFAMASFRRLGMAKKFTMFGQTIVTWSRNQSAEPKRESEKASLVAGGKRPVVSNLR